MTDDADAGARALIQALQASRLPHEGQWRDCYDYALPTRNPWTWTTPRKHTLYDGTASAGIRQLAAEMLSAVFPAWMPAVSVAPPLQPGGAEATENLAAYEDASIALDQALKGSNLLVQASSAFFDLLIAGMGSLVFFEAGDADRSPFWFEALPASAVWVGESRPGGRPDITYRAQVMTVDQVQRSFPSFTAPSEWGARQDVAATEMATLHELVRPRSPKEGGFRYDAWVSRGGSPGPVSSSGPAGPAAGGLYWITLASDVRLDETPFLHFRWETVSGEVYALSPMLAALADVKTANKMVELVLKNASIAVAGIWQADDDGVLNPNSVVLAPGTIIPKAVGSAGLTPLQTPRTFDVSDLTLEQLRQQIRSALFVDRLQQIRGPRMTATEVLERSAEMARVLATVYARLQLEFLEPLVWRALRILKRLGRVDIDLDAVRLVWRGAMATQQSAERVRQQIEWTQIGLALGGEAAGRTNPGAVMQNLHADWALPGNILREEGQPAPTFGDLAAQQDVEAEAEPAPPSVLGGVL